MFKIASQFEPRGDQPFAIDRLVRGLKDGKPHQILKGVTGSGKTYVMAKTIEAVQRPTIVITHNKTLVGQLYQEFKAFFPENAVEHFVSYYDYYQPEAYVPSTDTYIEKDSQINEEIDYLRHRATASLFEREDIVIVASVSCIYGLGSPENYMQMRVDLKVGDIVDRDAILRSLVRIQYQRSMVLARGCFIVKGDVLEVHPKSTESAVRVEFFGDEIEAISLVDPLTGVTLKELPGVNIFPAQHYVTPEEKREAAIERIEVELQEQEKYFLDNNMLIEAQRIRERTRFDLEMIREIGFCKGIENYSRQLEGRGAGTPPDTLLNYLPHNALIVLDESHVTIPQLKGMYNGDQARKQNLVRYGFRLPSALDNRPLKYEEYRKIDRQTVFVSATPGPVEQEIARSETIPLIVRPTGLVDPKIEIRSVRTQVDDVISECALRRDRNERVFVTTLTKKMAEDLTEYLCENGILAKYLHSDIETIERLELIRELRLGKFDVLVGINLLREGLDVPEVSLVCVLDADKEGFLRSTSSLIQISGRAARNVNGTVIYYADRMTDSMKAAIRESDDRRRIQTRYNEIHGITPQSVSKKIYDSVREEIPLEKEAEDVLNQSKKSGKLSSEEKRVQLKDLSRLMAKASEELDFELAARLRDRIFELQGDKNRPRRSFA